MVDRKSVRDADPFAEPEAYASLRREATALCAAVEPMADEADEAETLHAGMAAALRESGLARATVPAAYGGRSESVDPRAVTTVREVLMGTSAHLDSLFGMQGVGSHALGVAGSPELREQWLPRVAALEALAALALTEPGTGSDLRNVSTTIRDVGDRLVVDGVKAFITNAGAAAARPTAAPATETRNTASVARASLNPAPGGPMRWLASTSTAPSRTSPRMWGAISDGPETTRSPSASAGTSTSEYSSPSRPRIV